MQIFLSFLLIFASKAYGVCDFRPGVEKVISFSGPTTVLLKELGLLQNKKLKGISTFNPIGEKEYLGKVYPGGILLSHNSLHELSGGVVFYDESRDLRRIFAPMSSVVSREVKTRNLTPQESSRVTVDVLREFLMGCEKEISLVENKIEKVQANLLKKIPTGLSVVFYLGEFKIGRPPEIVMVQDGVVKWLIQNKKIKTYPSELAYANWSAKILKSLPKNTLHVGIKDSARTKTMDIKKSPQGVTLTFPGSLVPGISQLEAFLYWAEASF